MDNAVFGVGFALIAVGVILVFLVIILASRKNIEKGKTQAAGVIMIGPIPIIFGTDKEAVKTVVILALALTVLLIVLMIIFYFLR